MVHRKIPSLSLQTIEQELDRVLHARVISGLDAARALAVFLVLIDHFRVFDHFYGGHPVTGPLGVMIFFVLSGFLITSMLLKEYRQTGNISLANFYRRRAYRIFPNFYCCWILTTVVYCLGHNFNWKHAALSFFYLMDYGRGLAPASVQPWMHMWVSWSLAIEEKFYLLWPLLLLLLLKRPNLIRLLVSIILGQWVYRAVMTLHFHVSESYVYYAFDMRADALLVGCLLAIMVENDRIRLLCCELLRRQWVSVLAPLALVLMVVIVPPSNTATGLVMWSMQPLIIAVMLLQTAYWGAKSWTFMGHAAVRLTAQLSYALYLYHPLAGRIVKFLGMRHLGYPAVILTLIMAPTSYYLVERPFMRMRDRQRPRDPAIPPVSSVANAIAE
jgi:peptidoglycan/LPS O-acetylase OafA/YrhL